MTKVAVIGIGQSLRGDDAAGLMAVHGWSGKFPKTARRPEVQVESTELPGLALLDLLEEVDAAVLVDAVQSSASPGTIFRLDEKDLSAFASNAKSAHGWGVAETLKMGRLLSKIDNKSIRVIGIAAEQVELGMGLSKAIQEAMPWVCEAIQAEVKSLIGK